MEKLLGSRKFLVSMLAFALISCSFAYFVGFTFTGVDHESYGRGEIKSVLGLTYWWPEKQGGYEPMSFQDKLKLIIGDGKVLSAEEMVPYLNPELKPIVKEDGKIYIYTTPESYRWAHVYWTSPSPVVSALAMARSYIP